jgi:hypothetical protein
LGPHLSDQLRPSLDANLLSTAILYFSCTKSTNILGTLDGHNDVRAVNAARCIIRARRRDRQQKVDAGQATQQRCAQGKIQTCRTTGRLPHRDRAGGRWHLDALERLVRASPPSPRNTLEAQQRRQLWSAGFPASRTRPLPVRPKGGLAHYLLHQRPHPPPIRAACFVVRDHNGQQLAYVYFKEEPGQIGGKIIGAGSGEKDCRKYGETARAIEPLSDMGSAMMSNRGEQRHAANFT